MSPPLTVASRALLDAAREEAARLDAPAVGTEHLLLALLRTSEDPVRRAVEALGVPVGEIDRAAREASRKSEGAVTRPLPLSAHAAEVLESAGRAATLLQADAVDPEHVLLGLVKVGGGAAQAMERAGLAAAEARARVLEALRVPLEARPELGAPAPRPSEAAESLVRAVEEARSDAEAEAGMEAGILPARELTRLPLGDGFAAAGRDRAASFDWGVVTGRIETLYARAAEARPRSLP